jgi:F1F0 ATPase subunit 2
MLVGLEMDGKRMTSLYFNSLPTWAMSLSLTAHLAAGIMLGVVYFRSLWWNARRVTAGGSVATTIAVMIGRFVLLGMLLTLASLEGALPLLVMALGILIARSAVVSKIREITS